MPSQTVAPRGASASLHDISPTAAGFSSVGLARADAAIRRDLGVAFPAAVLLVARDGGVAMHRAYGHLDPETCQEPTQRDSLFDLASVSKLFTATAFMTLVQAGKVTLQTPVPEVLGELEGLRPIGSTQDPLTKIVAPVDPAYAGMDVDTREVTFWHLLTHTSGLAAWRSVYQANGAQGRPVPLPHEVPAEVRVRRIATILDDYGFAYPPEQRLVYSDLGLILLGEAIARLSGIPLDRYVQRSVLQPLGLTHSTYNPLAHGVPPTEIVPTEECAWRKRRCIGEVHDENAASLGGVAGHAGLFSTAWEVAALGQMYLNRGHYGGTRLLCAELVEQMTRTQADWNDNPRGLGWMLRSRSGSSSGQWFSPSSYGHTGFTGTSLWIDPDRALIVVLLTNRVYSGRDRTGIARLRPLLHDAIIEALV
jgi:CubicO group peptidase (beta-lactamase class C family)